ncbi:MULTISPECIES: hypothetical protein [unclassified Ensifer]|uniref:hypothetical protein n=1 Tax=unclassified Ensifer TaxID=2633371 RepID=UPI00300F94E8
MIKTPFLIFGVFLLVVGASVSGGTALSFGITADATRPGVGLMALSLFDLLIVYGYGSLALQAAGLGAAAGRLQWIVALVAGVFCIFVGIVLVIAALALLNMMLALFLALPFGTAVYLAVFGSFATGAVRAILAMVMTLKLAGLGMIVFAAPGVLRNTRQLVLTGVSLLFTFGLGYVYALVPVFLVSIVDAIAAIVFGVAAVIWFALLALSGVGSLVRTARGLAPG